MKYLKLGPKATSFYDQSTATKIVNAQVVEVEETTFDSKGIQNRLDGGHIKEATEEEYQAWITANPSVEALPNPLATTEASAPAAPPVPLVKEDLAKMDKPALLKFLKNKVSAEKLAIYKDDTKDGILEDLFPEAE